MYYICTTTRLITKVSKCDYHIPPIGGPRYYLITTIDSTPDFISWYGAQYCLRVTTHKCVAEYPTECNPTLKLSHINGLIY